MECANPIDRHISNINSLSTRLQTIYGNLSGTNIPKINKSDRQEIRKAIKEAFAQLDTLKDNSNDYHRLYDSLTRLQGHINTALRITETKNSQGATKDLSKLVTSMQKIQKAFQKSIKPQQNLFTPLRVENVQIQLQDLHSILDKAPAKTVSEVFDRSLTVSRGVREQKLAEIQKISSNPEPFMKEFRRFNEDLVEREKLLKAFNQGAETLKRDPDNESLSKHQNVIYEKLKQNEAKLMEIGNNLGLKLGGIFLEPQMSPSPQIIILNHEKLLNMAINVKLSEEQTRSFINSNKHTILQCFLKSEAANFKDDLDRVKIELKPLSEGSETHNGGKQVFAITFSLDDKNILKIVSKPRNAVIDAAVIDTFKKINALDPKQKSGRYDLPTYTIVNPSGEGWQNLNIAGEISLWEFIEGETMRYAKERLLGRRLDKIPTPNTILSHICERKLKKYQKKLNRMDAILTGMEVSDLHLENIMIVGHQKSETREPELIPIDLEVIQSDGTGLGTTVKKFQLTPEEMDLVNQFKGRMDQLPHRILPLATQRLLALMGSVESDLSAVNKFKDFLKAGTTGCEFTISDEELSALILCDVLNGDCPYMTKFNQSFYYGLVSTENIIGKGGKGK
jgi:hypothetical protein